MRAVEDARDRLTVLLDGALAERDEARQLAAKYELALVMNAQVARKYELALSLIADAWSAPVHDPSVQIARVALNSKFTFDGRENA